MLLVYHILKYSAYACDRLWSLVYSRKKEGKVVGLIFSLMAAVVVGELSPAALQPEEATGNQLSSLYIYALNAGYKDADGVSSQNYDFVELKAMEDDLSLDGYRLVYTNSVGNEQQVEIPTYATLKERELLFGF